MPVIQKRTVFNRFGIWIPPFKYNKLDKGFICLDFIISAKTIPSKKNSSLIWTERKRAYMYINKCFKDNFYMTQSQVYSAVMKVFGVYKTNIKYKQFVQEHKPTIHGQMQEHVKSFEKRGKLLTFPLEKCKMTAHFYLKDDYVQDVINKFQSVQDFLVECGVITDDSVQVIDEIIGRGASFKGEVNENLCVIYLSFNM